MAGWKTGDMLGGIEGIMNLAAASGEDLATTSDIVTDALTAFGLSAEDSGHFADILAAASSNANTNVSMMGETFKYCAPIAGAARLSAEDTARGNRPDGQCRYQVHAGRYRASYHHEQSDRRSKDFR